MRFVLVLSLLLLIPATSACARVAVAPADIEPQLCTTDVKLCPDGRYVRRAGPNCEFAPCSAAETPKSDGDRDAHDSANPWRDGYAPNKPKTD